MGAFLYRQYSLTTKITGVALATEPTPMTPAIIGILSLIIIVLSMACYYFYRDNVRLRYESCTAARALDHLAGLIDVIKIHSPEVRNNLDVQKLSLESLEHVEDHRRFRRKNSPHADMLINDLGEMAGKFGPRENLYSAWAAHSARHH